MEILKGKKIMKFLSRIISEYTDWSSFVSNEVVT